jgi:hypothetical protein
MKVQIFLLVILHSLIIIACNLVESSDDKELPFKHLMVVSKSEFKNTSYDNSDTNFLIKCSIGIVVSEEEEEGKWSGSNFDWETWLRLDSTIFMDPEHESLKGGIDYFIVYELMQEDSCYTVIIYIYDSYPYDATAQPLGVYEAVACIGERTDDPTDYKTDKITHWRIAVEHAARRAAKKMFDNFTKFRA